MSRPVKPGHLTIEQVAVAEDHLRFVLNTAEGIVSVLGTTIHAAMSSGQTQPETKKAFDEVMKSINKTYAVIRDERTKASTNLKKRALKSMKDLS